MRVCRRGRLEVFGSHRRSIVGERHGASLTTRNPTERFEAQEDRRGFSFSGHHHLLMPLHLNATVWYDRKVLCKLCCTAVMQKSNAPYSSVFLSCSVHSCIWIPARSCDVPSQSYIFSTVQAVVECYMVDRICSHDVCYVASYLIVCLFRRCYGVPRH